MSEIITLSSDDENNTLKIPKASKRLVKIKHETNHEGPGSSKGDHDQSNLAEFKRLLDFCAEIEIGKRDGSPRLMKRIKEKLLRRFNAADSEYTESKSFKEAVSATTKRVEKDPSNLFVHLKQVDDELKIRSKQKVNESVKRKATDEEDATVNKRVKEDDEDSETKTKHWRHVQKLERLFHKVYRKCQKLGEKEVDWDNDEDDSLYLRWSRYQKRLYLIWEKWQEARGRLDEVKRLNSQRIAFSGTRFPNLNHAIELHVNKTRHFPDFHDILKLTTETLCPEGEKALLPDQLQQIAADAFRSLGNQLQKRRVFEFWNGLLTHLPSKASDDATLCDPAEKDATLEKALQENYNKHKNKMNEVINKFVDQQVVEKLEPKEVLPGMEDEDSRSDEEEEMEDEEDDQEVIAISSSSEESDAEAGKNGEQANGIGDANHSENDVAGDAEGEVGREKEEDKTKEKGTSSIADKNKKSSSVRSSTVQSEPKVEGKEPVASCSFSSSNRKAKERSEGKKKFKSHCDVVMLSASDSDQ